jgi:hypothetical protein
VDREHPPAQLSAEELDGEHLRVRVDHRAVHEQVRRLVDRDQVFVLEQDL